MKFETLVGHSLVESATMFWSILWALILGFILSAITMAFVPTKKIISSLGKAGPREIGLAVFLGAISSSCSYAAASMTRSLFQKGAHIITALAFMFASTNLVFEMSLILWLMLGWQFVLAEFIGGLILVCIMSLLAQLFLPMEEFENIRIKLNSSTFSGHSNVSEQTNDPRTLAGWQAVAQAFVMEWQMIWKDIAFGILASGFLMIFVPEHIWQTLFMQKNSNANWSENIQLIENALLGPLVSIISFVCSIGNIPLAGTLYKGGIKFSGALSFIYADLIIIPLILIYRKYFGAKLAFRIVFLLYISMVLTGMTVEILFNKFNWIPQNQTMEIIHGNGLELNYTFYLNIFFILLSGILIWLSKLAKSDSPSQCC